MLDVTGLMSSVAYLIKIDELCETYGLSPRVRQFVQGNVRSHLYARRLPDQTTVLNSLSYMLVNTDLSFDLLHSAQDLITGLVERDLCLPDGVCSPSVADGRIVVALEGDDMACW